LAGKEPGTIELVSRFNMTDAAHHRR
jgi:hypothetical protein